MGGEDVIIVWWEKSNSLPWPLVIKMLVYLVFWMLLSGGRARRRRIRSGLIPNKTPKKTNGECITISESLLSGWWESSVLKWNSFWWLSLKMLGSLHPFADCSILPLLEQGFQRVQNCCGTSPSMRNYDFKEFWPLNLTKSSEFDVWKKGMWVKLD